MKDGFPPGPRPQDEVLAELSERRLLDVDFRAGRSFGLTYHASRELDQFISSVAAAFAVENAFSSHAMPSIQSLQREIVAATTALVNGSSNVNGSVTSGGTESIVLAVKTAKALARRRGRHGQGSVVGPVTAHPAFRKACDLFSVRWVGVPVDDDFRVRTDLYEAALQPHTLLAIGSAPSYPWGMIDDIEYLADLARDREIPFHVDACIGGFLLPFIEGERRLPRWDFRVPGVTSMSLDLHKFGYGARGASVLLHHSAEGLALHRFECADWPGGPYSTQGVLGTRPAAPIAVAWAVMQHLGRTGYERLARDAMAATEQLVSAVDEIPGLYIVGAPDACVVAIGSQGDIPNLGHSLRIRGWHVQQQEFPPALHLMVSAGNRPNIEAFLDDLRAANSAPVSRPRPLQAYGDDPLQVTG